MAVGRGPARCQAGDVTAEIKSSSLGVAVVSSFPQTLLASFHARARFGGEAARCSSAIDSETSGSSARVENMSPR